jgi:arylsulfatase A-like enzyme
LILIDTLRADHLGCYGSDLGLTPVLDGIAARGTLFEYAVAPSSWTRSTVASLFASRYPSAIGVLGREDAIAPGVVTLAEVLRDAGVETLGISTNRNAGRAFGFDQGFDRFEVPTLTGSYPGDFEIHVAEGVTQRALTFLDDRSPHRPFFLFLHYVDPHDPYLPHPELLAGEEPPGRFDGSRRDLDRLDAMPPAEVTGADRARVRHLYAGEVRYCDLWIGELLRGLEERGLRDRVLLVVTSDHGEGLWDHGVRGHGRDLYEEQVHVPLILEAPADHDGDRPVRVSAPVSLLDVAPTILAAHGIAPPFEFRGVDLTPLARGERRARRLDYVYTELDLDRRNFEALRHGDQKLIRDRRPVAGGAVEHYDLAADPGELTDLAGEPSLRLSRLERALDGVVRDLERDATEAERVELADLDRETAESLRALGYLRGAGPRRERRQPVDGLAAAIDFGRPDHPEDQLAGGFYELENGRRWMSGRAGAVLGRSWGEERWQLSGWLDLGLHGRDRLTVTVRVDGGEVQRRTIESSGFFDLEGPLPPGDGSTVRLDFECDHEIVPSKPGGDQRSLCAIVQSIALF